MLDATAHGKDLAEVIRGMTDGRGPDSVIDAVGMEAHGSPGASLAQKVVGVLPDGVAEKIMQTGGMDQLHAFYLAIDIVRRGGTISLIGVCQLCVSDMSRVDQPPSACCFCQSMAMALSRSSFVTRSGISVESSSFNARS